MSDPYELNLRPSRFARCVELPLTSLQPIIHRPAQCPLEAAVREKAALDSPASDLQQITEASRTSHCSNHFVGDPEGHQERLLCQL